MTNEKPKQDPNFLNSIGFRGFQKVEDLMKNGEGKYFVVNVIAKRAKDINANSKPAINVDDPLGECYPYATAELEKGKLVVTSKKIINKLVDVINERA